MKAFLALAGAVLLGTTITACGGDNGGSDGSYCTDLKSASKTFDNFDSGDLGGEDETLATLHKLAGESPSEIEADWKVLDDGIMSLEKALSDAGIEISDFAKIEDGQLPEGVDPTKLQGLTASIAKLSDEKFANAGDAIQKHAKDSCGVTLK